MSTDIITKMIEANCIEHGHFELANVHTDNLVRQDFIYNFEIADIINYKLYQVVKGLTFDTIVTWDNIGTIIAYPITLMMKKPMRSNQNKSDFGEVIIITSLITSFALLKDFNNLLIPKNVRHIVCVTNYSGIKHIDGIDVVELVPVNTWSPSDCPYCKDLDNE